MSANLPNGTKIAIASAYAAVVAVTAITNANPAVATAAGHGLANGDIVVIESGWAALDGKTVRVASVSGDSFALEGIDTSREGKYEPGAGIGRVSKVTAWTPITQVTGTNSSGGEQQFVQWVYLEDGQQRQRPTFKNARSLQITLADDVNLPWNAVLKNADEDGDPRAVRFALANGGFIYYNMYVSFNDEPTTTANEIMSNTANLSLVNRSVRYAA